MTVADTNVYIIRTSYGYNVRHAGQLVDTYSSLEQATEEAKWYAVQLRKYNTGNGPATVKLNSHKPGVRRAGKCITRKAGVK